MPRICCAPCEIPGLGLKFDWIDVFTTIVKSWFATPSGTRWRTIRRSLVVADVIDEFWLTGFVH